MAKRNSIRFGDYIQAMSVDSQRVPFLELMPEPLFDRHGNEHPQPVPKMKLGGGDVVKLLQRQVSKLNTKGTNGSVDPECSSTLTNY